MYQSRGEYTFQITIDEKNKIYSQRHKPISEMVYKDSLSKWRNDRKRIELVSIKKEIKIVLLHTPEIKGKNSDWVKEESTQLHGSYNSETKIKLHRKNKIKKIE